MSHQEVAIRIVEGKQGPFYKAEDGFQPELSLDEVVITEKGTVENRPIVDFVLTGPDGKRYMACITGRLVKAVADVITEINHRNKVY